MPVRDTFRWIHLGALALVAVGLPWSNVLMSLGQLVLAGNFITALVVHRDRAERALRALRSPALLVFLSFYALHALGLLWSADTGWGLDLCRILAPVVVFSVILAASPPLDEGELKMLLLLGAFSTIASTLTCLALRPAGAAPDDYRALSLFISHIRLALLLCMSLFVLVAYFPKDALPRVGHVLGISWCVYFLDRLESLQGIAIVSFVGIGVLWRSSASGTVRMRRAIRGAMVLALVAAGLVLTRWVREFHRVDPIGRLDAKSAGGEPYFHDLERPGHENGHAVWVNVAYHELRRGWSRRSNVPFDSTDAKGHRLRYTLVRYMASLGLRKDSLGVLALSVEDVRRIEAGVPSVMRGRRGALRDRVEEILFELDEYRSTGNPSGYSIAMRLEFWKTGWAIARREWLHGVGTGDTQLAFDREYERRGSLLQPQWRLRAHNEYLTLWISFGAFGLLWSLFAWTWPAWRSGALQRPLFMAWAITFAISCLSDDTIETQAGATFFAFFYCLFVFSVGALRTKAETV